MESTENLTNQSTEKFSDKMMTYPKDCTLCFFYSLRDVENFLQSLRNDAFDLEKVDLLVGEKGLEIIDLEGTHHWLYERLLRLSQKFWGSGEWYFYAQADYELKEGHYLLKVATKDEKIKDEVVALMKRNGGHDIKYFNSMYVEEVTNA